MTPAGATLAVPQSAVKGAALPLRLAQRLLRIAIVALVGGLLTATFMRIAPGFGVDERELDARLSESSLQKLRSERAANSNVFAFYLHFLSRAAHGDFGVSETLGRPVGELISQRLPLTLRLVSAGLAGAWILGVLLAAIAVLSRSWPLELATTALASTFVCIPAAGMAVLLVATGGPGALAIALAVCPKVFSYTRNLLAQAMNQPYIVAARARGLSNAAVLLRHVLPGTGVQLLAVFGVSVSLALGAAVPVEAICDLPGIGQLAWQAALGRDLPLLVTLTLIVTLISLVANSFSDVATWARAEVLA